MGHIPTTWEILYGSTAAGLYDQAAKLNAQARTLSLQSSDTYYKANDAAAYDDWVRARNHWDYSSAGASSANSCPSSSSVGSFSRTRTRLRALLLLPPRKRG